MLWMRNAFMAVGATVIVGLDQVTKAWALKALDGMAISLVDGFLALRLGFNYGLAFGFLGDVPAAWRNAVAVLPLLALFILVPVLWRAAPRGWPGAVGVSLVLGGAIGNLIDRVRVGAVVDFIDFYWRGTHWPAFNIADSAIAVGVGLLSLTIAGALQRRSEDKPSGYP